MPRRQSQQSDPVLGQGAGVRDGRTLDRSLIFENDAARGRREESERGREPPRFSPRSGPNPGTVEPVASSSAEPSGLRTSRFRVGVGFGHEQPPVRSWQLDAGSSGRVQPMGRSPYVVDRGHRLGPPCDLAHPHRRETQPPLAASPGCLEQPSDRSGKGVVNGNDELREMLDPDRGSLMWERRRQVYGRPRSSKGGTI